MLTVPRPRTINNEDAKSRGNAYDVPPKVDNVV